MQYKALLSFAIFIMSCSTVESAPLPGDGSQNLNPRYDPGPAKTPNENTPAPPDGIPQPNGPNGITFGLEILPIDNVAEVSMKARTLIKNLKGATLSVALPSPEHSAKAATLVLKLGRTRNIDPNFFINRPKSGSGVAAPLGYQGPTYHAPSRFLVFQEPVSGPQASPKGTELRRFIVPSPNDLLPKFWFDKDNILHFAATMSQSTQSGQIDDTEGFWYICEWPATPGKPAKYVLGFSKVRLDFNGPTYGPPICTYVKIKRSFSS